MVIMVVVVMLKMIIMVMMIICVPCLIGLSHPAGEHEEEKRRRKFNLVWMMTCAMCNYPLSVHPVRNGLAVPQS